MQPVDLIPGLPDDIGLDCLTRVSYQDFASCASVCRSWKHLMRLPEFWQHRKVSGFSRNVVVMAQYRDEFTCARGDRLTLYEPETNYCTELPPPPGYPDGSPLFCQLIGTGSNLVVIGGRHPQTKKYTNDVFIYNFVSATWSRGTSMPGCGRLFFACASDSKGKVFVAGGQDDKVCQLKSAMTYDVAKDKWESLPDMPRNFSRSKAKAVYSHGKFNVINFSVYLSIFQGRYTSSFVSFDVATQQWSRIQDGFLSSLSLLDCMSHGDGKLFRTCGDSVEELQGPTWQVVAKLPDCLGKTLCMIACPGKVLVIGLNRYSPLPLQNTCERYKYFLLDLKNSKWKSLVRKSEWFGHVQSGCCLEL